MSGLVIPFCIYYNVSEASDIYWSRITSARVVETEKDGKIEVSFECSPELFPQRDRWVLGAVFYAISPIIKPIPRGMVLMRAHHKEAFPYDTTKMNVAWNPFTIYNDANTFVTYSRPVQNTIPMYFWERYEHVFPTFSKNPPSKGGWEQSELSPIWVMWDWYYNFDTNKVVKNNRLTIERLQEAIKEGSHLKLSDHLDHYTRFICQDNICVPDPKGVKGYINCLLPCLEKSIEEDEFTDEPGVSQKLIDYNTLTPQQLFAKAAKKTPTFFKFFKATSDAQVIIVSVVFGVSFMALIFLVFLKGKRTGIALV